MKENFKKIIIVMIPVAPHLANECLEKLNVNKDIEWPIVENKYLIKEKNDIVIQVNGKKEVLFQLIKRLLKKISLVK